MTRKAARTRQKAKRRTRSTVRASTRTKRARTSKAQARTGQQAAAARRESEVRPIPTEDNEDLDWLNEDEDPRSQIVEDEEQDPEREEEW
jgi:hypothetical protein